MLYLEDYLEMIEHLPGELRDRFTEMRELDLTVHNCMDSIEKKCRNIFLQCKRGELDEQTAEIEFNNLRQEFYKALEDADEKVNIATQVHELVERYLRRLDSELFKFKCELEADNNGITEILERRALESDNSSSVSTSLLDVLNSKENQDFVSSNINTHGYGGALALPSAPSNKETRYRTTKADKRRDNSSAGISAVPEKRSNMGNSNLMANASTVSTVRPITPGIASHVSVMNVSGSAASIPGNVAAGNTGQVAYNLQQLGGSASTAIAAAASQAIVATQQMQQGRRTASLKASYEAIHGAGGGPTEFWISRDIANAANVAAQNTTQQNLLTAADKKQKKKLNSGLNNSGLGATLANNVTISSGISIASSSSSLSVDSVDMLPTNSAAAAAAAGVCSGGLSVIGNNNTTLNSLGFSGLGAATTSTASNAAVAVSSSSRGGSASSSSSSVLTAPSANLTINENGLVVEHTPDGDWTYDPNEPRYCTCNQVSYGDMVACDNDACPYEWFHYPCVGITQPPKGKWYCPKCTVIMRRRGSRKN